MACRNRRVFADWWMDNGEGEEEVQLPLEGSCKPDDRHMEVRFQAHTKLKVLLQL